jgi:hypothetical protein
LEALAQRCFAAVCADASLPLARVAARLFPPGTKHKAVFNAMLYVDGGVSSSNSSSRCTGASGPAGSTGPKEDGDEMGSGYQINGALDCDLGDLEPWCRSHGDPGLLTLLARSDHAALQLQAHSGSGGSGVGDGGDGGAGVGGCGVDGGDGAAWVDVEPMMDRLADETRAQLASTTATSDGGGVEVLLLVAGYSLERLTAGAYRACVHRVPRSDAVGARRRTAAFELRPAVDIWRAWRDEATADRVARSDIEIPAADARCRVRRYG